jgi:ATP-dependent HslUV protease ATP-binding subunit HslU
MKQDSLTPRQIVKELDKYIIGQDKAKKSVAIAIRNRWRRLRLTGEMRDEVMPKNIIMIGPTGVGKTEIARRMANLAGAPFLKVEASKYTEVGYVGRSVESMIRDLTKVAVSMVEIEVARQVESKAMKSVNKILLKALQKQQPAEEGTIEVTPEGEAVTYKTRAELKEELLAGALDNEPVEIEVTESTPPPIGVISNANLDDLGIDVSDMIGSITSSLSKFGPPGFGKKKKTKKMSVHDAREVLLQIETEKLIDQDSIVKEALYRVQNMGIIFIDEMDKICGKYETSSGPDVSREGVQRDLLPIVEGTTVNTPFGMVKTDHILFIAAGAFHTAKPSDLIPEMQGRFPIRVELDALGRDEFLKILTTPKNSLTKQYAALLGTEGVDVEFEDEALEEIAAIAERVNQRDENIGARRLHTIMEKVIEEYSFDVPDKKPDKIMINSKVVDKTLKDILKDENLSKYIL